MTEPCHSRGSRGSRAVVVVCVSILQLVLATRIFFGDLQCFGCVPVFFQPLERQSCMQVCSGGREPDCVRRQALPFTGCTAQGQERIGVAKQL